MIEATMKVRLFIFFPLGLVLGAAIFWLPTALAGGNGFVLPVLFFEPWYLLAAPYIVLFVLVFGVLAGIYHLLKRPFPISVADGVWILLGLYLSLTFFFYFVGIAVSGGKLTI